MCFFRRPGIPSHSPASLHPGTGPAVDFFEYLQAALLLRASCLWCSVVLCPLTLWLRCISGIPVLLQASCIPVSAACGAAFCLFCSSCAFRFSALRGWDRRLVMHLLPLATHPCLSCTCSGFICLCRWNLLHRDGRSQQPSAKPLTIAFNPTSWLLRLLPSLPGQQGLLRILHTVQEFQRSTSTGPPSAGSGRPALDLTEVFTGTIDQASIQMAHPRTAALAVRHLESRCDSIVRLLDALEASVHRRSD